MVCLSNIRIFLDGELKFMCLNNNMDRAINIYKLIFQFESLSCICNTSCPGLFFKMEETGTRLGHGTAFILLIDENLIFCLKIN